MLDHVLDYHDISIFKGQLCLNLSFERVTDYTLWKFWKSKKILNPRMISITYEQITPRRCFKYLRRRQLLCFNLLLIEHIIIEQVLSYSQPEQLMQSPKISCLKNTISWTKLPMNIGGRPACYVLSAEGISQRPSAKQWIHFTTSQIPLRYILLKLIPPLLAKPRTPSENNPARVVLP